MASGPWCDEEIHLTVDIYFRMLTLELAGESYSKSEFRREVAQNVDRSSSAIDYKFNNVSAVLDEVGAVWIPGYKPLRNVQAQLREVVRERFTADSDLRSFMLHSVRDGAVTVGPLGTLSEPPESDWPTSTRTREGVVGVDYAAVESANRSLGGAGELSVVEAERRRLTLAGRADLAAEVRHVAAVDGDGLGYDVRSFLDDTDQEVFIEVKTTKYDKELPFYLTSNELEASNELGPAYRLFRLYLYGRPSSGYYTLLGPLATSARLRPETYRGLPARKNAEVG